MIFINFFKNYVSNFFYCKESSFTYNPFPKNYFSFYNTSHGLDELLIDIFIFLFLFF